MSKNQLKCGGCGGNLEFAPGTNSLKCPYCGKENKIEGSTSVKKTKEIDLDSYLEQYEEKEETVQVKDIKCGSCRAVVQLEKNMVSGRCPYCDTPFVIEKAKTHTAVKPQYLLPFGIDDKKALQNFRGWIASLWFAPSDLKRIAQIAEKLNGMYLPFWTYDCETNTYYTGERGNTRTETVTDDKGNSRTESYTSWSSVSGYVSHTFDDVLVPATKSLPKEMLEELEPWDLKELATYDNRYLRGFQTESYQIDLKEGYKEAQQIMQVKIDHLIERDIGGDSQRINSRNISYTEATFKHICLPVWVSAFRYKEKLFQFVVNARTGEVQGKRPWSVLKIAAAAITVLVLCGIGYYFNNQ